MNKKQMIGACIAAGLFIVIGVTSVLTHTLSDIVFSRATESILGGEEEGIPTEPFVGIVNVSGTIQQQTETEFLETKSGYQHNDTLHYIDEMIESSQNKGMLLKVDSPGGTIYESEELYLKIQEYKEKTGRPVWTYMEHYAASGGYYISAPSDKIYANPNTTTGSIGVIISGYDMTGLYEKLGIRTISITSGPNKDMSQMNEEQMAIYQASVDESYERFVQIVAEGRNMSVDEVKTLADGRIYTAKQAKANGLVDEISLYDEMKADMEEEVGNVTFYQPSVEENVFAALFGKLESLKTKSEAEILTELTEQFGSGVPMYYAEQLQ